MTVPFLLRLPLALAAVVAIVATTYPNGLAAAARDLRDYTVLSGQMAELAEQDADMTARAGELQRRLTAKEAVVADLIAGRMSLDTATARFVTLNGDDPQAVQFLHSRYDGSTLEEKVARNVVDHATATALRRGDPEGQPLARLDREFRLRYGHSR